nr:VWA domain-containing protein [Anaerolineae bacterium]
MLSQFIASLLVGLLAIPTPPINLNILDVQQGEITLNIRDATGVPPNDLQAGQFSLRTVTGQTIAVTGLENRQTPNVRVSLALVIDTSGSMAGKPLADAKAAAKQVLAALGPNDRAAVISFADQVRLDAPFPQLDPIRERDFTLDKVSLAQFVDGLSAGGNTPLYDAAVKAVRLTAREVQTQGGNIRRAVIFLTDGRDETASGSAGSQVYNDDSAIIDAKAQRVPIFTIGLGAQRDKAFLTRLATLTGGQSQDAPDSAQLTAQFRNVLQQMKTVHTLRYDPTQVISGTLVRVSLKFGDETSTCLLYTS